MKETVRIDLKDSDYAIVLKSLLHRTARQVQEYYRKYMRPVGKGILLSEIQSGKSVLNDFEIDMNAVSDDEVTEIFMLNQVIEWSFGPVTSETINGDNMPSDKYILLQKELNELYKPSPFPVTLPNKPI